MSTPTTVTQSQLGFAEEIAPYGQDILGRAEVLATKTPYQAFEGEQVAQFSPLQQQSYDYASQMQSSPQLQDATALAGQAGLGALNTQYTYNPSDFNTAFSGATTRDAQGNVTGNSMMNPYMQNVVDVQSQQARRQADITAQGQQAQAANAGAFGGGRDAIMRAQGNAELQRNLQGIQATGLNNAYTQAMNQYNTQNQQNAQQQQFGASLGMQGLGLANTAANTLGSLGQTQYAQNVGITGLQNQLGLQQQQQAQNVINADFQSYQNEINDPYKKLGFYSDIVRGAPIMQTGSSVYQQGPSAIQNLTSLGLGAYGLSSLFGGSGTGQATKAEGGVIKGYAGGGSVMSPEFKRYAVDRIDPRQLQLAQRNAMARGDRETAGYTVDEMAEDAALRRGIAGAMPEGASVVRAAGGGIIAFKEPTQENNFSLVTEPPDEVETETVQTGGGNARLGAQASQGALATAKLMAELEFKGYTPDEINSIIEKRYAMEEKLAGPSPYGDLQKYISGADEERTGALSQARGMAALEAAAAALQPGGTARGLAGAASAFGKSYGQALQADRKEKRSLASMKFNVADAQRKERMGMTRDASAAATAAQKDRLEAHKAEISKLSAIGRIQSGVATANRVTGGGAGGAGKPKFLEDTARMQDQLVDLKANPKTDPAQIKALEDKIAGRLKIYGTGKDIGPGKADVEAAKLAAATDKDIDALVNKAKFMDDEWQAALGNSTKQAAVERRIRSELITRRNQEVNKNSGNSGRIKFDSQGNQIK